MRVVVAFAVLCLFLVACSQSTLTPTTPTQPAPNTNATPHIINPAPPERPDIPRVNPPADTPDIPNYQNAGEQPSGNTRPVFANLTPKADLDVPLGDTIGQHHPIITVAEFKLLRHQPIRVSGNQLVGYEETLNFDFGDNSTGKIVFQKDDITTDIGSFLLFEEHKPIFEYRVTLDRGTFESLQGRDIQILGHTYTIAEATNASVTLYGKDVPNNLKFVDGQALTVNSSGQTATICRVTPFAISYELFASGKDDGNILLSPGESLRANIGWQKLASFLFDIKYAGAPMQGATTVGIKRTRFGYDLTANLVGGNVEMPLVEQDAGRIYLGRSTDRLRITPCDYNQYCVRPEDNLLFTTSDGKTYLRRYGGSSENPNQVHFYDANNSYTYEFSGTPGVDARTDIVVGKTAFPARIGPKDNVTGEYNITVEQGYRDGRVEMVLADGTLLRIGDITNTTTNSSLPLEFTIPGARTKDRYDQKFTITLVWDGDWHVDAGNLTFVKDDAGDTSGMTPFGATILLAKNRRSLFDNQGDSADILIPRTTAYGIVSLEG